MSEQYGLPEPRRSIHESDQSFGGESETRAEFPPAQPPEVYAPGQEYAPTQGHVPGQGHVPVQGHTPGQGHAPAQAEPQPQPGPATPPPFRRAERAQVRPAVPRWLGRLPYAFVLCGVMAGLVVVALNHFRRGSMLIAASIFIGALARLLLPESQVGMLAVRRRWVDVLLMTTAAVGVTLVAFVAKGTSG